MSNPFIIKRLAGTLSPRFREIFLINCTLPSGYKLIFLVFDVNKRLARIS